MNSQYAQNVLWYSPLSLPVISPRFTPVLYPFPTSCHHISILIHTHRIFIVWEMHYVYIIHWVQFVLLIYWNVENAKLTWVRVLKNYLSPSPRSELSVVKSSSLRDGGLWISLSLLEWTGLILYSSGEATTTTVHGRMHQSFHVQKTLFCLGPPGFWSLTLSTFLYLELCVEEGDKDVSFVTESFY